MEDRLRVTMIATGLGGVANQVKRPPKIEVVPTIIERTGTDNLGLTMNDTVDYEKLDQPAVVRRGRSPSVGHGLAAFDSSEIPAFLRKQAD